jgi:probable addiction module antidote protein
MTKTSTTIWDPSTHLRTTDDVAAYLEAALQDGDPQLVAAALGDIARETLENQADLRDNDHVIVGAHWGDGQ